MRTANLATTVQTDGAASSNAVGYLMNNLRTWLDHHHIEPADFVRVRLASGQLAFDVHFRHEQEALMFEQVFTADWRKAAAELPLLAA